MSDEKKSLSEKNYFQWTHFLSRSKVTTNTTHSFQLKLVFTSLSVNGKTSKTYSHSLNGGWVICLDRNTLLPTFSATALHSYFLTAITAFSWTVTLNTALSFLTIDDLNASSHCFSLSSLIFTASRLVFIEERISFNKIFIEMKMK